LNSDRSQTGIQGRASGGQGPPVLWVGFRFLLPSVVDLIFIALLVGLAHGALTPGLLRDAGIGWHIRNGQHMLRTHSITRMDPFSCTMSGRPWFAWEWLYDILIAATCDWAGLNGVLFFTALVIAATFAWALRLVLRGGAVLPVAVVLLVLSVGASSIHFLARPHVVSWLFTVIWLQVLESWEIRAGREAGRRLLWLPVLMLFWVNLHGGFLLGMALLGLYLIASLIRYSSSPAGQKQAARQRWQQLAAVTLLSSLASLINPYGYKLHAHIYHYLSDRWLLNHIDEFHSPDFHGGAQQCFAALLLIAIVGMAIAPKKPPLSHLLVTIFAAYTGLYASRNLPLSALLLTWTVAPLLSQAVAQARTNPDLSPGLRAFFLRCHSFTSRMGKLDSGLRGHLWPLAAAIMVLVGCLQPGWLGSHRWIEAHFDRQRLPVEAAEVIAQRGIGEPIFAPDSWGGYLIYRLYPQTQVFVDDRHDLYGAQFMKDYLKVLRVASGWNEELNEKRVNWVLLPAGCALANMLKETTWWRVSYEDSTAILFHRTSAL
jgi:hypothetical protein